MNIPIALALGRYIALGDSISIDLYPAADVAQRYPGVNADRVGAASLFFRNADALWPEFAGRDLHTLYPELEFRQGSGGWFARGGARDDLTADAATTETLLSQVGRVAASDEPTLITITAGGNDLLAAIGFRGSPLDPEAANPSRGTLERLRRAVERLLELRPQSTILLGTVYDPSDGTHRLPGFGRSLEVEAGWLRDYNEAIRDYARSEPRLRLADIHAHFVGHGLTAPERERWYLAESIIEPNARGASEVRRVWLEAIGR